MSFLRTLEQGIVSCSPAETRTIAQQLALHLPEVSVVALYGDLGVGKTTFVQGLAQAWGITVPVTSPTFNLYSIYEGTRRLVHLDAYRLESAEDAEGLLLDEFLIPPYCLVIEWPAKLGYYLDANAWKISFEIQKAGLHTIRLKKNQNHD